MSVPGYDRENDPSPDVCTTEPKGDDGFIIRHFPNSWGKVPCCTFTIQFTEEDAKHPHGTAFGALARADRMIVEKHAKPTKQNSTRDR